MAEVHRSIRENPSLDKTKIEIEIRLGMVVDEDNARWRGQVASERRFAEIVQDAERGPRGLEFRAGDYLLQHRFVILGILHMQTR